MAQNILVVDDDLSIIELLTDFLGEQGYDVVTAADGKRAYEKMEAQAFDLVISDVLIPKLNGFDLLDLMSRDSRLSTIPVIIFSGIYRSMVHRQRVFKYDQAKAFLDKPLRLDQLLESVTDALSNEVPSVVDWMADTHTDVDIRSLAPAVSTLVKEKRMPIHGELSPCALLDALGALWEYRQSGSLVVQKDKTRKILYLDKGKVVGIKSNNVSDCLGRVLVHNRMITAAQCKTSIEDMVRTKKKQGELLVERKVLTQKNLAYALELQFETKLFSLFEWDYGTYCFTPTICKTEGTINENWSTPTIVVEGSRRYLDVSRVQSNLEQYGVFELNKSVEDTQSNELFDQEEAGLLSQLRFPATAKQLIDKHWYAREMTTKILFSLIALGFVDASNKTRPFHKRIHS